MLLWPFNKYPGTDYETFNWEWIISTVKRLQNTVDEWVANIKDYVLEILSDHPEWIQNWMLDDGAVTASKLAPNALPAKVSAAYLDNINIPGILGSYTNKSFQAMCYNSSSGMYAITFSGDTLNNALLVEMDGSFNVMSRTVVNAGHANDITYDTVNNNYVVAPSRSDGEVIIIDAASKQVTSITLPMGEVVSQISYNSDTQKFVGTSGNRTIFETDLTDYVPIGTQYPTEVLGNSYENIGDYYFQGSDVFDGKYYSTWFFFTDETRSPRQSVNRIVAINLDNTDQKEFYDIPCHSWQEEGETVYHVNDQVYFAAYDRELISRYQVSVNGFYTDMNQYTAFSQYQYTTDSTIMDDLHTKAPYQCEYKYQIVMSNEHPELGGFNGILAGCKPSSGYGWQNFENSVLKAWRTLSAGTWSSWHIEERRQEQVLWFNDKPFRFYRRGPMVTLYAPNDLKGPITGGSYTTIGTLSEPFRPIQKITLKCSDYNAQNILLRINETGLVEIYMANTLEPNVRINGNFNTTYCNNY